MFFASEYSDASSIVSRKTQLRDFSRVRPRRNFEPTSSRSTSDEGFISKAVARTNALSLESTTTQTGQDLQMSSAVHYDNITTVEDHKSVGVSFPLLLETPHFLRSASAGGEPSLSMPLLASDSLSNVSRMKGGSSYGEAVRSEASTLSDNERRPRAAALLPFPVRRGPDYGEGAVKRETFNLSDIEGNLGALARAAALLPFPAQRQSQWQPLLLPSFESDVNESVQYAACPNKTKYFGFVEFVNALRHGDTLRRIESGGEYKELRELLFSWTSLLGDEAGEGHVSLLWLGCFDGPEPPLMPLMFAADHPKASVAIVHACLGRANVTALSNARQFLGLKNLLMLQSASPSRPGPHQDDEFPDAWRARSRAHIADQVCDILVVSPGALRALLDSALPSDAELIIADAFLLCNKTIFIQPQVHDQYWSSSLWKTPEGLIGASMRHTLKHASDDFMTSSTPIKAGLGKVITVLHKSISQTAANNQIRYQPLRVRDLQSMFGLADSESFRIVANAVRLGSFIACGVTRAHELSFDAGELVGCNLRHVASRRFRWGAMISRSSLHADVMAHRNSSLTTSFVETKLTDSIMSNMPYFRSNRGLEAHMESDESTDGELRAVVKRGGVSASRWWPYVKSMLRSRTHPFSVMLIGEDLGMLALRLARKHTLSTFVVKIDSEISAYETLLDVLGVHNTLVASGTTPGELPPCRGRQPNAYFNYVLLGAFTVLNNLHSACSAHTLTQFGSMLSRASNIALVELPQLALVAHILDTDFGSNECARRIREVYLSNEVLLLKDALASANERRKVLMDVISPLQSFSGDNSSQSYIPAEEPLFFKLTFVSMDRTDSSRSNSTDGAPGAVSLTALLGVGITTRWRAWLLRAHLEMPLWKLRVDSNMSYGTVLNALSSSELYVGPSPQPFLFSNKRAWRESLYLDPAIDLQPKALAPSLALLVPTLGVLNVKMRPQRNESVWRSLMVQLTKTPSEHRNGHFSFFEWGATKEPVAADVGMAFPNATVISIGVGDDGTNMYTQSKACGNVVVCRGVSVDKKMARNMYESPELARYSLLALENQGNVVHPDLTTLLMEVASNGPSAQDLRSTIGALVSSSLTTFLPIPSALHVELAMRTIFDHATMYDVADTTAVPVSTVSVFGMPFESAALDFLAVPPNTGTTMVSVQGSPLLRNTLFPPPLARIDLVNITRRVHHHFDWSRDGHKRTYTLHVDVNKSASSMVGRPLIGSQLVHSSSVSMSGGGGRLELHTDYFSTNTDLVFGHHVNNGEVVHVHLTRDEDLSYIPYGAIQSITLIAAIRLGLVSVQRKRAFSSFVRLPLYEDMAPWNVAFKGSTLTYIDYDTQTETYDTHVSKVYRVLSVLMNYKRTVQDLGMCGQRARTKYDFSHVSDCVKSSKLNHECDADTRLPVPCDDGHCHSDFISCLRALSALQIDVNTHKQGANTGGSRFQVRQ